MLDEITKRRINSARDILVGKLPDPKSQVEQITIALIYKFMDDMDRQAEALPRGKAKFFAGEFKKHAWRNIFSPQMGGHDVVTLYGEAIQTMNQNPNVPQLFRDIFKNAYLPYRDPETLKSFLKEINEFEYDHSERLGDAFEYLLSVLGSQGDAGQFRTPRNIIDFMVEILEPKKNEKILDPACGTAGFLISAYKHIIKHNSKNYDPNNDPKPFELQNVKLSELTVNGKGYRGERLTSDDRKRLVDNISGYDISPDMVRLSLVNMYLHGFSNPKIYEYDTLSRDDKWDEKAEVILANPPFMSPKGGIKPHTRFSVQSNRSEVLFVDYMAEHLTSQGRAAIIVPEGIIFQTGTAYVQLRKILVEEYLVGVISLPAGLFNPYSGVKTSILWLDKQLAKKTKSLLFFKIENDGYDLGAQRRPIKDNDLPNAYRAIMEYKESLITGKRYKEDAWQNIRVVEKSKVAKDGDYGLNGERYGGTKVYANIKWPVVELGDVAEVISGQSPEGKYYNQEGEGLPFYQGKTEFSEMYLGDPVTWTTQVTKIAEKNDILMSVRAPVGPVNLSTQKICIGRGLAAIRVNPKKVSCPYLFYILRNMESKIVGGGGAVFDSINRQQIQSLKIPLPPLSVQKEIVAELDGYQKIISGARQIVENYTPQVDIDSNWPLVEIGKLCELATGGTPRSNVKEYYENGTIKWLVSGDIHKEEIHDCDGRITELGMKESNAKILPLNSVLIALNGQGKTRGTVALLRTEATCNQSLVAIYPFEKTKLIPEYLFLVLKSKYQEMRDITGDNQRSGLNMPIIRNIKISLPPIEAQKRIVSMFEEEYLIIKQTVKLIEKFKIKTEGRIAKVWGEK